jgi:DNA-binding CsgD family transcriptional regulator
LPALAWVLAQQGDYAQSHALLGEALVMLIELGDKYHLASCVSILGHLAVLLQQPMRAVQLLGAMNRLQTSMGGLWPAFVRNQVESTLAQLRTQLGKATFGAAWAEGQAISPEQLPTLLPMLPETTPPQPASPMAGYPAGLSEREVEVLRLLTQGLTNAQIAAKLIVSPYTVNAHLRTIYGKLDVPTRAAATRYAIEHKLV